jgi:hypothetical protein
MLRATHLRRRNVAIVCSILIAGLAAPGYAPAQSRSQFIGRTAVTAPERTDAGEWDGTWFYVTRARKMAVWIRTEDGKPRMKLRLLGQSGGLESFTTDWDGQVEYQSAGRQGAFSVTFDQRDENTITGSWAWSVKAKDASRDETADFTIYRAGWGRQMIWKIENLQHEYTGDIKPRGDVQEMVWLFRKASRREALWSELPF